MCLGGHLALRAAFHRDIAAYVSFFGTDIHSNTLGTLVDTPAPAAAADATTSSRPPAQHTLDRIRAGELTTTTEGLLIFGTLDPHVPPQGRDLIRTTLRNANANFSFFEIAGAQHAFVRDEFSKGRYDPAVTGIGFTILLELFNRVLKLDLGTPVIDPVPVDHVC
jgi:carboxymethylenebutenolidase